MVLFTQLSKGFTRLSKKTRVIIKTLSIIILSFLLIFLILRFSPYGDLKDFTTSRQYSTRIYDCNHNLIQILPLDEGLRREYIPLKNIPGNVKNAFIQAEDKRFFKHFGVDISAIFRAIFQNADAKETISGASTITMQLARIISPQPKRNIFSKIKESINAIRLELRFSKDEILEMYLNNIPFGFNTEGVATAARTFFGKSIFNLSQNEIISLAVIPRRPATYNPLNNPENCAERASAIFNKSKTELLETTKKAHSFKYEMNMPHYINYLKSQNIGLYGKKDIVLSADLYLQKYGEKLLAEKLELYSGNRISNGAILLVNTITGEIITWIGSGDFYNKYDKGQIDGVLATNQPGSSMKPFLYCMALDHGYSPGTVLPDIPTDFGFEELYVPQNFNNRFNGPVRFRVALASSLNVPAVYLLNKLGINTYIEKLKDIGFYSIKNQDAGLGLALGNGEVSLFELVQGFSTFPRDGYFIPLRPTSGITTPKEAYSKDSARIICNILSDKAARATGFRNTKAFDTPFPSIFKTGTANQYQNITALAATPLYTVGVWMGNFDGETVVGKTGSSIPAAIAKAMLEAVQHEIVDFKEPEQWEKAEICSLSGMIATDHCPHKDTEYIRNSTTESCTWHSENGIEYPAIYNNWLNQKNREGFTAEVSSLAILSPKQNSVFYFDNNAGDKQKLFVEFTSTKDKETIAILENHTTGNIKTWDVTNKYRFTIPIERGNFTLTVRSGDEEKQIDYVVY